MQDIAKQNNTFNSIYSKSYRLVAAVFAVFNFVQEDNELRTKIKNLALDIVSMTVQLKDTSLYEAKKISLDIEKKVLLLMSLLDIASISNLISEMNGRIVREEFSLFINELNNFINNFDKDGGISIKSIFKEDVGIQNSLSFKGGNPILMTEQNSIVRSDIKMSQMKLNKPNGGRKESRKSTIISFIKGHDNVSIKDIVPNIIGCSEKTIQRELIELINEGKIKKTGERRWSRYSIIA